MLENLKNSTIYFGREPQNARMLVAMKIAGNIQKGVMGEKGSVPQSVSRCIPDQDKYHCRLYIDNDGSMTLSTGNNYTYVGGFEIESKRITPNSNVALGIDKYPLDIKKLLELANKIIGSKSQESGHGSSQVEYSIRPLEKVWNDYHNEKIAIKMQKRSLGLWRSVPMMFSMFGGLIAAVGGDDVKPVAIFLTALSLMVMIYGFLKSSRDKSIEREEELQEEFQENYVCPNPKCRCFMGNISYTLLRQRHNCPNCKCKLTE